MQQLTQCRCSQGHFVNKSFASFLLNKCYLSHRPFSHFISHHFHTSFQCRKMTFDSSKVCLAYLYTDGAENITTTDVYANGYMQAVVYISVNYSDSIDGIKDQISNYVYDKTNIMDTNGITVNWTKSDTSNEFLHDINRSSLPTGITVASDFRVPVYFTVPVNAGGQYRWIAELNSTKTSTPVTVTVTTIAVYADDMEIVDIGLPPNESQLRSMRYVHGRLPGSHLLLKWKYRGFRFDSTGGNSWLVMMRDWYACGAILEPYDGTAIHVAKKGYTYHSEDYQQVDLAAAGITHGAYDVLNTSEWDWEDPSSIPLDDIKQAWKNGGLAMVCIGRPSHEDLRLSSPDFDSNLDYHFDLIVQDNFGNFLKVVVDWDYGGNYHKDWKVESVQNYYQE